MNNQKLKSGFHRLADVNSRAGQDVKIWGPNTYLEAKIFVRIVIQLTPVVTFGIFLYLLMPQPIWRNPILEYLEQDLIYRIFSMHHFSQIL